VKRLSLLLLAGLGITACGEPPAGRTILLVSLDSVRADTLDFDDAEAFPNLARLAQGGAIFDQAIAGSSWTLPSHATMFTGAPPPLHGVEFDDIAIDPGFETLPELLHAAGWYTAGWWTGWYTAGEFGFERGFDTYTNAMTGGREIEQHYRAALAAGETELARRLLSGMDIAGHRDITSPHVVLGLEATVETIEKDRDLFLFTHLFDPHYDYIPPAPFDTRFDPDYTGTLDGNDFFENKAIYNIDRTPARHISDRDLDHIRALY
jgi:arylsulfatase A-like enzyme